MATVQRTLRSRNRMDVFQDPAQDQENQHVVKAAKNVIPTKRIAGKEVVATKRAALGGKTNVVQPVAAKTGKPAVEPTKKPKSGGIKKTTTRVATVPVQAVKEVVESSKENTEEISPAKAAVAEVENKTYDGPAKHTRRSRRASAVNATAGTGVDPADVKEALAHEQKEATKRAKVAQDWDDLDVDDHTDPLMAAEYAADIDAYSRYLEKKTMARPDYMDTQNELTWKMRGILIDWLIEVHHKFRLLPETLYLAVNIIDRFLSSRVVSLVKLQLVGLAAMFIAAKYEEVVAPTIQNFNYMADNGYTEEEIVRAERYILNVLGYQLHYPSPMNFLRRGSKADNYDIQNRTLAKYLMEVALVDHRFLKFEPSRISAAGLYLARTMLNRGRWTANLRHYTGYSEEDLDECTKLMLDYLGKPTKHEALFKKYASKKFLKASIFVKDWMERCNASSPAASSEASA